MMHLMGRLAEREAGRDKYYSTAVKTAPERGESRERFRQKPKRQFAVLVNPKKTSRPKSPKRPFRQKSSHRRSRVHKKIDEIVNNYEIIKPLPREHRIVIYGVDNDLTKDEVQENLVSQNNGMISEGFEVLSSFKGLHINLNHAKGASDTVARDMLNGEVDFASLNDPYTFESKIVWKIVKWKMLISSYTSFKMQLLILVGKQKEAYYYREKCHLVKSFLGNGEK
ncbi:hypothetical protein AVEN_73668-1 [Araneus ventricosus]|uniref:Uncharacterized protein n=1 Tax=Araneus ventricosus TaxID=182803 RepID=A0A4Y2HQ87_ARAVE|nr:hypothetical protein AVEN_73668-1 [Araneus ventricosus]